MRGSEGRLASVTEAYEHADPHQCSLFLRRTKQRPARAVSTRRELELKKKACGGRRRLAGMHVQTDARSNQSLTNAHGALGGSLTRCTLSAARSAFLRSSWDKFGYLLNGVILCHILLQIHLLLNCHELQFTFPK